MIDTKRLLALLADLVSIDSQNPPGNETAVCAYVAAHLKETGMAVKIHEYKKGRPNVVAVYPGSGRGKSSLLITPHLDTVPAGNSWKENPFTVTRRGRRLFGLGTTDCKGNLACALEALRSLSEDKVRLPYKLVFAATADEESGSGEGLLPLLKRGVLDVDAAVVLDADDFEIVVTQKGLLHMKLSVRGRKAHGAYPWLGINAIDAMLGILTKLKARRFAYKPDKFLHPPTVNIGTIKGGDKVNVVADWCECELDFRFLPGSSAREIVSAVRQIAKSRSRHFEVDVQGVQQPYRIDEKHVLVRALSSAMRSRGIRPRVRGSEGATVITFFQHENIPAIATGFGTEGQAHMADEYVTISNLAAGAGVLADFLRDFRSEA